MYIIKVYKIKNIAKKENGIKTWDLEFVQNLPYKFIEAPVKIVSQLNDMFHWSFEHIIGVE